MDDELRGNENRARQEKAGVRNRMSQANADSGFVRPDESRLRGLCSANPMRDPHAQSRGYTDNAVVRPGEKPRSHYTAEDRRRFNPRSGDTYE
jgi:hypothetical protein